MADSDALDARLRAMEQRLVRLRIITLLSFVTAAVALGYTLLRRTDPIVEGRLWIAKDEQGRTRGMFGLTNDGVALTMYDSTGQMRLDVGIAPGGVPGLLLVNGRGEPVATLNASDARGPALRMTDVVQAARVEIVPRTGVPIQFGVAGPPDTTFARRVEP